MEIAAISPLDDDILVEHFLALRETNGTLREDMRPDAKARVLDFIREGRERHGLGAFLAMIDGEVAGSIACQKRIAPYPDVVAPARRRSRYGYIWSVYVTPAQQRRGVGRCLMEAALAHLRSIGCTVAVLHASIPGERLYRQLGFELAREMRLNL